MHLCYFDIAFPPFCKNTIEPKLLEQYKQNVVNDETNNICSFFLEKAISISDYVSLVFPKFLLNTPEFKKTRDFLSKKTIDCIIDFGEKGFPGVLVETLAIFINNNARIGKNKIIFLTQNCHIGLFIAILFLMKFIKSLTLENLMFSVTGKLPIQN